MRVEMEYIMVITGSTVLLDLVFAINIFFALDIVFD